MATRFSSTTATILNTASLSGAVALNGTLPYMLILPTAWTSASITFQASADGTTYGDVYSDDGTAYTLTNTYTAATGGVVRAIVVDGTKFVGANFIKIQSGTLGSPTAQGADRIITLGLRDL